MKRKYFRGHKIILVGQQCVYEDTKKLAGFDHGIRPCKKCDRIFEGSNKAEPDLCLGRLPGVNNACCGHGIREEAYIRFTNGVIIKGFTVEEY